MLTTSPLTTQHTPMDIYDHCMGICTRFVGIRDYNVGGDHKFGLETRLWLLVTAGKGGQ